MKLSGQPKAKEKDSLPDSGMNQAELHNRLLMENEDTNGSSFALPKLLFSNTLSPFRHFCSILITKAFQISSGSISAFSP